MGASSKYRPAPKRETVIGLQTIQMARFVGHAIVDALLGGLLHYVTYNRHLFLSIAFWRRHVSEGRHTFSRENRVAKEMNRPQKVGRLL